MPVLPGQTGNGSPCRFLPFHTAGPRRHIGSSGTAFLLCYAVCLRCDKTHLTVCRVIAVLLSIPRSLFLQQVPLSVIEVSEYVRAALEMGELVLWIVEIDFRALCGFLFQSVSDQVIGTLFSPGRPVPH